MKNKKLKTYQKVFIGLVLGITVGTILSLSGGKDVPWIMKVADFCAFLGNIFIRLIKMVVVPLVFLSIATSIASLRDMKRLRKIGIRTVLLFGVTSALAITIGLCVATVIKPGAGINLAEVTNQIKVAELPGIYNTILDMIPVNIFESFTHASMLQIIIFSIFVGIAIILLGKDGQKIEKGLALGAKVMYKMVDLIVFYIPIGAFGLMTNAMATYGTSILGNIFKFILTDYLAAILQVLLVYIPILLFVAKVNPIKFFRVAFESWLIAFSTCTSAAALPVSMKNAKEKLGIPDEIASFVLPFGATANMDGTGIFFGIIVLFAAQVAGVELSLMQLAALVLQATLLSIGCAAVPQIGLVIGTTMILSMGLPVEVIGLVTGIYRILDQIHTATNATGDLVIATAIAGNDGTLTGEAIMGEEVGLALD